MDQPKHCPQSIYNYDISNGDYYEVNSYHAQSSNPVSSRRYIPAECFIQFYFRQRMIKVDVHNWWCDPENSPKDIFLAIYDDCSRKRIHDNQLVSNRLGQGHK